MSGTKCHAGSGTCTDEELSKMEMCVYYYFFLKEEGVPKGTVTVQLSFREAHGEIEVSAQPEAVTSSVRSLSERCALC